MSFSESISDNLDKVVLSYIEKVAITFSISRDELVSIWKGGKGTINIKTNATATTGEEIPNELAKLKKNELVELCKSKNLKHGGTRNDLIQRILSSEKQAETQPLITPQLVSKVEPLSLRRNKFGNFEHLETSFVFNQKTAVYGKQNVDGSIAPLTVEDINICNKYKFSFEIPANLQQQDDKVELAELDEDEVEVEVIDEEDDQEEDEEEEIEVELEIDEEE